MIYNVFADGCRALFNRWTTNLAWKNACFSILDFCIKFVQNRTWIAVLKLI